MTLGLANSAATADRAASVSPPWSVKDQVTVLTASCNERDSSVGGSAAAVQSMPSGSMALSRAGSASKSASLSGDTRSTSRYSASDS